MPTPYRWLLFDADDTLFDFRRAELTALRASFEAEGIPFDAAWLDVYGEVNRRAWRLLEEGRTTPARLRVLRFEDLFAEIGVPLDAATFSQVYLEVLGRQAHLVDGALEVVDALRATHRIAIITNGLSDVQRPRLAASPIAPYVEALVISEEVGVAKPDPAIFAIALERMGGPDPGDVLVIGDSLSSDIAGGVAAGIDTAWFNPTGARPPSGPTPTYEIARLAELPALLDAAGGRR